MISELDRALERAEAAAWADFYRSCEPEVAERLGVRAVELPGAIVTVAKDLDVLAFNRAIVTGLDGELEAEQLDAILSAFRDAGPDRAFLQIHPALVSDRVAELLESRGLVPYNRWMKLWCSTSHLPDVRTDLEIIPIDARRAMDFAHVVVSSFGWPRGTEEMIASCVGREGWAHYAAVELGSIVATAAYYAHEDTAWLDFAATLAGVRGRGAQSALLARRIADAGRGGCSRVVVETSEPRPDNVAQSHRNVTRLGFSEAYARPNFLWTRS